MWQLRRCAGEISSDHKDVRFTARRHFSHYSKRMTLLSINLFNSEYKFYVHVIVHRNKFLFNKTN